MLNLFPILTLIAEVLKIYFPAMVANAAPVFLKQGKPLDLGAKFIDGRRILGNGKTFEGVAIGLFFGTYTGIIEALVFKNTFFIRIGFIASVGALLGDVFGSFIKRRLGLKRGDPAPILDQLDFIYSATLFLYLIGVTVTLEKFIVIQLITLVLHIVTNRIAYVLKLKPVPW